jgi:putative cardiolipin synthase
MISHAPEDQLSLFPDRCQLIKVVPEENKRRFYALRTLPTLFGDCALRREDAGTVKQQVVAAGSTAGLHTKAAVFDRESIFVGNFNFDPRSGSIKIAAGFYAESPELATELIALMDEGVAPANAYHVQIDREGELFWVTEEDGYEIRLTEGPGASIANRFLTDLIITLPVEDQL